MERFNSSYASLIAQLIFLTLVDVGEYWGWEVLHTNYVTSSFCMAGCLSLDRQKILVTMKFSLYEL